MIPSSYAWRNCFSGEKVTKEAKTEVTGTAITLTKAREKRKEKRMGMYFIAIIPSVAIIMKKPLEWTA